MLYGEAESNPIKRFFFASFVIFLLLSSTSYFIMTMPVTGPFRLLLAIVVLVFFRQIVLNMDLWTGLYLVVMLLGCLFHLNMPQIEHPFYDMLFWIGPAILLLIAKTEKPDYKSLVIFAMLIFVALCSLDIFERLTYSHPIEYKGEILEGFVDQGEEDETVFRSFGLLGHPLDNANSLSIIIAFIYASCLKKRFKWMLLVFGLVSLWTINSRGAMLIWLVILFYDLILRDKKWYFSVIGLAILLAILPSVLEYVEETEALGRLSDFDFTDDSTLARFESWGYFFMHNWSSDEFLLGGTVLYIPGTDLLLENGLLLNIAYWGWIIGPIKLLLEIIISWTALRKYLTGDKIVILLATWGIAMMNNNSFNRITWTYFAVMCVAFASFNFLIAKTRYADITGLRLPESLADLLDGGKRNLRTNNLEKARLYIDKALELYPDSGEAAFLSARLFMKENRQVSTAKSLLKTLILSPDHRKAFCDIEELCRSNRDVIVPIVMETAAENPDNEALAVLVANILIEEGKFDEVIDHLNRFSAVNSNEIYDIHNILAEAYAGIGNNEAASHELALSTIHNEKYFELSDRIGVSE